MKSVKKIVAAALVGLFMFSAVGCSMIQKTDESKRATVVADVNGEKITLGEVDDQLKGFYDYMAQIIGENFKEDTTAQQYIVSERTNVVDSMVADKVLIAKAKQLNIVPSDEELTKTSDERFATLKESLGDQFQTAMDAEGFTEESLKDFLKQQAIAEAAVDYMVKDVNITDQQVQEYYDKNKDQLLNYGKADVRHLLFKTEDEANAAKAKIDSGEVTFDQLFEEYKGNKEKRNAANATDADKALPIAEDLGTVAHNEEGFDTDFLNGLRKLTKDGEISDPVKSNNFGYFIIEAKKITPTTPKEYNDDLKKEIKDTLTQQEEAKVIQSTLKEWEKEFNVKVYDDRLGKYF